MADVVALYRDRPVTSQRAHPIGNGVGNDGSAFPNDIRKGTIISILPASPSTERRLADVGTKTQQSTSREREDGDPVDGTEKKSGGGAPSASAARKRDVDERVTSAKEAAGAATDEAKRGGGAGAEAGRPVDRSRVQARGRKRVPAFRRGVLPAWDEAVAANEETAGVVVRQVLFREGLLDHPGGRVEVRASEALGMNVDDVLGVLDGLVRANLGVGGGIRTHPQDRRQGIQGQRKQRPRRRRGERTRAA